MPSPLGYLLTFRTYGTWLHGDERGSVDEQNNCPGAPLILPNERRLHWERGRMPHQPMLFDDKMRACVDNAIRAECAFRGWELVQLNVRTNHVHIVACVSETSPERMIGHLKSRATRMLRVNKFVEPARPVWADGVGSRRYLWCDEHIRIAEAYVREGQDVAR